MKLGISDLSMFGKITIPYICLVLISSAQDAEKIAPSDPVETTAISASEPSLDVVEKIEAENAATTLKFKELASRKPITESDETYLSLLALVIEGMRSYYNLGSIDLKSRNLKEYFSSDKFTSDYASGAWSGEIGVVIDGVPFNLGAKSSNEAMSEFREKVKHSKDVQLTDQQYLRISESFLPPEAFEVLKSIVEGKNKEGFSHSHEIAGQFIIFKIGFTKSSEAIPWPVIRSVRITNGRIAPEDLKLVESKKKLDAELVIRAIRNNSQEDVALTMETSMGTVVERAPSLDSASKKSQMPIGSIVASVLPFDKFLEAIGESPHWQAERSSWAPADGRFVLGSPYARYRLKGDTPDLRGTFLRGLNVFDADEIKNGLSPTAHPDVDALKASTSGKMRLVADYQEGQVGDHNHRLTTPGRWGGANREDVSPGSGGLSIANGSVNGNPAVNTDYLGTTENRPQNVAVYYYIRIR